MDSRITARTLAALLGGWRAREPAYAALADAIRLLCLENRIAARTALPAERELATALALSRTTVAAAYRSLRATGHIESTRGSGSVTLPLARNDTGRAVPAEGTIDLQQASPPAWPGLAGVIADVSQDAASLVSRSGYDILGAMRLREAIAAQYTAAGVPTTADQVLVTAGAQAAIHLLAAVLVGRGDRVLIETPTYPHAADAFRRAGGRLVGIPVSPDDGWDLDRAEQALERTLPVAAYLMPDFQNPTGRTMSVHERAVLATAAARARTTVIIDETTAPLDIDRGWTPPPFGADALSLDDASLVRLGSLGKTVWGGLRVGWVRADAALVRRLVAARSVHDLGTPDLEQAVATALLPRLPDILPQRAQVLGTGRDAVVAALRRRLPQWRVPQVHGGVALWVELDAPMSADLVLDVRSKGLYLSSGPRFSIDGGHDQRLRIPFTAGVDELERAVDILTDSWPGVRPTAAARRGDLVDAVV